MGWTSILTSIIFAILGLIIYYNPNTTFQIITVQGSIISIMGILMIIYSVMDIIEELIFMKNIKSIE